MLRRLVWVVAFGLDQPTMLAIFASLAVAALTTWMATRVFRAYRSTRDLRLLFLMMGFLVLALKSFFVAYVVESHAVRHDSIEAIAALFDLVAVGLIFVPFVVPAE